MHQTGLQSLLTCFAVHSHSHDQIEDNESSAGFDGGGKNSTKGAIAGLAVMAARSARPLTPTCSSGLRLTRPLVVSIPSILHSPGHRALLFHWTLQQRHRNTSSHPSAPVWGGRVARGTSKPAQLALYRRRLHSIHRIPLYVRFKSEVWAAHPYHFILRINPGAEPSTTCRFITGRGTLHNETTPVPYVSPPGLTQTSARWTACHCDEMKASLS